MTPKVPTGAISPIPAARAAITTSTVDQTATPTFHCGKRTGGRGAALGVGDRRGPTQRCVLDQRRRVGDRERRAPLAIAGLAKSAARGKRHTELFQALLHLGAPTPPRARAAAALARAPRRRSGPAVSALAAAPASGR